MANTKSAQRDIRASRRRLARNKPVQSLTKTRVAKAERQIFSGNVEAAREQVALAIETLDKAAEKGIIHRNNAARRKSRLMKKLNAAGASAKPAEKAAKPE